MKKTYLLICMLCISSVLFAQKKGTIVYKETTKMDIKVDGISDEMLAMLPKERTLQYQLLFTESKAFIKTMNDPTKNQNIDHQAEGNRIVIKTDEPDNKTYFDLTNQKCFDQKEFMGKVFLIESDLKTQSWKISGEQKEILGYACFEAILNNPDDPKNKVSAWFCPALPGGIGPLALGNLPGIILEININDGATKITAQKIELDMLDEKEMVKPSQGKKVSKKEFNEIVEAKRKEMQEQYGGEGNVIIKIRN
jgi:GLPGLI family protein